MNINREEIRVPLLAKLLFLSICFVIVLAGYLFQEKLYRSEKQQVENALSSIGTLKASEITVWMKEKRADTT